MIHLFKKVPAEIFVNATIEFGVTKAPHTRLVKNLVRNEIPVIVGDDPDI